jgi:hypothetical protein
LGGLNTDFSCALVIKQKINDYKIYTHHTKSIKKVRETQRGEHRVGSFTQQDFMLARKKYSSSPWNTADAMSSLSLKRRFTNLPKQE